MKWAPCRGGVDGHRLPLVAPDADHQDRPPSRTAASYQAMSGSWSMTRERDDPPEARHEPVHGPGPVEAVGALVAAQDGHVARRRRPRS